MKKNMLLIVVMIILLVGCSSKENALEGKQINEIQVKSQLTEEEIKNRLIGGKWLAVEIMNLDGTRSKITRLDLFGSIYKYLDGIKFYADGTFSNNIGIAPHGEEENYKGHYTIQDNKIILTYDTNNVETLDIRQNENNIILTIKNLFNYSDEDYMVYYAKFDLDEDYNKQKIHSEENFVEKYSGEKIIDNISNANTNKKLEIDCLKDFFLTIDDPLFESMQGNGEYNDNEHFIKYGMDGKFYGFEEDFWGGCSVWCVIQNYTCNAKASSTLEPQGKFSYEPSNLINGIRANTWIEGADGYGIGEFVEISKSYTRASLEDDTTETENKAPREEKNIYLETICIVNGYAENMEKWINNSRVKELKMYFNGKYISNIELRDTMRPQYFDINSFGLKVKSGEEYTLKFEIADVYEGDKYDDTAITGIEIGFWTANH